MWDRQNCSVHSQYSGFHIPATWNPGESYPEVPPESLHKDNPKAGERRRVWASCQVDGYSDIAGGHSFRQSQGERMRFKVLHKISDYKKRFGYHMCVGCGRCENVCPEYISYIACLQKLKEKEGK